MNNIKKTLEKVAITGGATAAYLARKAMSQVTNKDSELNKSLRKLGDTIDEQITKSKEGIKIEADNIEKKVALSKRITNISDSLFEIASTYPEEVINDLLDSIEEIISYSDITEDIQVSDEDIPEYEDIFKDIDDDSDTEDYNEDIFKDIDDDSDTEGYNNYFDIDEESEDNTDIEDNTDGSITSIFKGEESE